MAKFKLKFLDGEFDFINIECEKQNNKDLILVRINVGKSFTQIRLDKSTSIKFSKALRTEINKITEREVSNE